jgi:hypothetical protein
VGNHDFIFHYFFSLTALTAAHAELNAEVTITLTSPAGVAGPKNATQSIPKAADEPSTARVSATIFATSELVESFWARQQNPAPKKENNQHLKKSCPAGQPNNENVLINESNKQIYFCMLILFTSR